MVKPKWDELKEEVEEQDEGVYGDETVSGSNPNPDKVSSKSTDELVGEAFGEDAQEDIEKGKFVSSGHQVNKDVEKISGVKDIEDDMIVVDSNQEESKDEQEE